MNKLIATAATITAIGIGYHTSGSRKIPLNPDQCKHVMHNFMPLLNKHYGDVVIGGSTALKIYTGRDFITHDTDYFLKSKDDFRSRDGDYHNATLQADISTLSTQVLPDHIWSCKLSSMNIYHTSGVDTQEIEQFDKAIGGTVNTIVDNNKVQFVMIDNSKDLEQWYATSADLPVFINFNHGQPYFYVCNQWLGLMAKCGYLFSIRHVERQLKYKEKGFKCFNLPYYL